MHGSNIMLHISSLSVGHVRSISELTTELGITLGDQSTSSVRKMSQCTLACSHCGNMTISVSRSRLQYLEETGAPSYISQSSYFSGPVQKKPTSVNNLGDLRVIVRNTPPSQSPRAPQSSMTL